MKAKNIAQGIAASKILDHREIGQEQDLFFQSEFGPGMPFFKAKGFNIKKRLISIWRRLHQKYEYEEIESPMLLDQKLWEISGHKDLYQENMFFSEFDKRDYAVKPMNCPGAILYYQHQKKSHNDLPLRVCELGKVHRYEESGSLHGILRARSFVVDDGHIFCRSNQLHSEVSNILRMIKELFSLLGFQNLEYELSLRCVEKKDKYLGGDAEWELAEKILCEAMENNEIGFKRQVGEAKFYGPAIDVMIRDQFGKKWQCSSIQLDFNLPSRFDLKYFNEDGKAERPILLHRCLFGSLERFIGILIEHYQGRLPFKIAPEQIRILPLGIGQVEEARKLRDKLIERDLFVKIDKRDVPLKQKIKNAQLEAIPFMLILGNKEVKQGLLNIRMRNGESKCFSELNKFYDFIRISIG